MIEVLPSLVVAVFVSALGVLFWITVTWNKRRLVQWKRAAARVGGVFASQVQVGVFANARDVFATRRGKPWMQIDVTLGPATLRVALEANRDSDNYIHLHTRIVAMARTPQALSLHIHKKDFLNFEFESITVGEPAFDGMFIVKSSRPDLARLWLTPKACAAMMTLGDFSGELNDGTLTLMHKQVEYSGDRLSELIFAAAEAAGSAEDLLADWMALANTVGGVLAEPADTWWKNGVLPAIKCERDGRPFTIARAASGGIEVCVARSHAGETFLAWPRAEPIPSEALATLCLIESVDADPFVATDDGFYDAYDLRTSDSVRTREWLTPEVRGAILSTGAKIRANAEAFAVLVPRGATHVPGVLLALDALVVLGKSDLGISPYR